MRVGIDASNIRQGGGVTHLVSLLCGANPAASGFNTVIVWCNRALAAQLPQKPWLQCRVNDRFDYSLWYRAYWQRFILSTVAKKNCDILFIPGGNFQGSFRPYVACFQNLLPFSPVEIVRYFPSGRFVRLCLLRYFQAKTFKRANGLIYLSQYAKKILQTKVGALCASHVNIPHGIHPSFFQERIFYRDIKECNATKPFTLLYVSTINYYKHQIELVKAVASLRLRGFPVQLILVGPAFSSALFKLQKVMQKVDPRGQFIFYRKEASHTALLSFYKNADALVFPSSCENLPIILLEAMASSLPIACSNRGVMKEVLRDAGVYFDPVDVEAMARAIEFLLVDNKLREKLSRLAVTYARQYTWESCAHQTFRFLRNILDVRNKDAT